MSQLSKLVNSYGGFAELAQSAGESALTEFAERTYISFCGKYGGVDWNDGMQWILRHYRATKQVMMSALYYKQAQAVPATMKNLGAYAAYYSLFNALCANLTLLPHLSAGEIDRITHTNLFKHTDNHLQRNGVCKTRTLSLLSDLRLVREAYSYHLPLAGRSSGDGESLGVPTLLAELEAHLAQALQLSNLISHLSYAAWEKKRPNGIEIPPAEKTALHDRIFASQLERSSHLGDRLLCDDGDWYMQCYVLYKLRSPFPIKWLCNKMCEELECGWGEPADDASGFRIEQVLEYLDDVL